jgi:hypothetical protein
MDELEERLSDNLNKARSEYWEALAEITRCERLREDLGIPHPDGTQALRGAHHNFQVAGQKFWAALEAWLDHSIRRSGKRPSE